MTWYFIELRSRYKILDRWDSWTKWESYPLFGGAGPQLFKYRRQAVQHAREYCYQNSMLELTSVRRKVKRYSSQVDYRIRKVKSVK